MRELANRLVKQLHTLLVLGETLELILREIFKNITCAVRWVQYSSGGPQAVSVVQDYCLGASLAPGPLVGSPPSTSLKDDSLEFYNKLGTTTSNSSTLVDRYHSRNNDLAYFVLKLEP